MHARGASISSDLDRARSAVGLPPSPPNAAVDAAAGALLKGKNPRAAFAAAGGSGELATAVAPAGSALSTAQLKRIVFDPRVKHMAGSTAGDRVAVAGTLDPTAPFTRPVLAGETVDPAIAGSIALLFPPKTATIPNLTLTEERGGGVTVALGIVATASQGLDGAILVQIKGRDRVIGPQLGYGLRYRLSDGRQTFEFRTRPLPPVLERATFASGGGFTGADRARFLGYIQSFPPEARRILNYIGGAITIRVLANTAPVCHVQTSCGGYDPGNGYFILLNRGQVHGPYGRFVIGHELGHLVDFLGLDAFSYDSLHRLFASSPGWKNCFLFRGHCTPFVEVFADQFSAYTMGAKKIPTGYNDPVLIHGASFSKLLAQQWAFRPPQERNPLAGFGPLATNFTDALARGGSGL
jgi:hypothetical protein